MPLDFTLPRMTNETNDKPWFEEIGLPVLLRHARTTTALRCGERWTKPAMTTSRKTACT